MTKKRGRQETLKKDRAGRKQKIKIFSIKNGYSFHGVVKNNLPVKSGMFNIEVKLEIITTVKEFPEKIRSHHISPDTYIRVIIDNHDTRSGDINEDNLLLPIMRPEEQRRLLNSIPGEYQPGASEELIKIIEESRINTDNLSLE